MSLPTVPDVKAARLSACQYTERFADAGNPLTPAQALVEAERCLYCHDAPCTTACPTSIDVPSFIHRIADGNVRGAAKAILEANPLGGMCARVCPTEELCEQACVRNTELGKPVEIGRLQRFAVDKVTAPGVTPLFTRAAPTGKHIAVVGAGPAGLQAAIAAARNGHRVTVFEQQAEPGGQVRLAASVPNRAEFGDMIRNQIAECERLMQPLCEAWKAIGPQVNAGRLN